MEDASHGLKPTNSGIDPTKKVFSLYEEFKAFAFKGNVIDLAVGVIIGAAFGKIVDWLVKQIIMPLLSVLMPGQQSYVGWEMGHRQQRYYGLFLSEVVNFLIVAVTLFFFVVKFLGWAMKVRSTKLFAHLR